MTGTRVEQPASPGVTVIIPTRGRPELVRAAVVSVVEQDYAGSLHCVVVHDQEEPDRTLESLAVAGRTVTVTRNEGRPGLAAARNWGRRGVETEFIASCDDDDAWLPQKLSLQVARLRQNPAMLVVGAGIRLLMPDDRVVEWLGRGDEVQQGDLLRSRRKELHSSTLLMRRAAFDLAGGYDEDLPQGYAEDYEWLLRAIRFGTIGVVRLPLANINKAGQSWFRERAGVIADALKYLLATHPELARSRRGHARILGQIAFALATSGARRSSLGYVLRSLRRWPAAPQAHLALFQLVTGADPRLLLKSARAVGRGIS